jgi:hypothetical protein
MLTLEMPLHIIPEKNEQSTQFGRVKYRLREKSLHKRYGARLSRRIDSYFEQGIVIGMRRVLAAASFLLYAAATIVAVHSLPASWPIEREVSIPTAISNVVYGLQLGLIDSNVLAEFHDTLAADGANPKSVEKAIEVAARGDIPRGNSVNTLIGIDGIGMGQPLFIDLAMRLFGPHLLSISYLFLLVMGISAFFFVGRYNDGRLNFVPLHFGALTCMLLTPLLTVPLIRDQTPIGGNRFFGILGVLPALHIFLEFADGADLPDGRAWKNLIPLSVQLFILVLVLLVRSADAYLLAPPICAAVFTACRKRDNRIARYGFCRKLGYATILGAIFTSALIACAPNYAKSGRIGGTIWHRTFGSFVAHPEWPFGNLRDVYDCTKYIPEGLHGGRPADRNGHCIWWAYPPNHTRPVQAVQEEVYGPEYEAVLRRAYFNVIFSYPREALELYLYYKPALIVATLRQGLHWRLDLEPPSILLLAAMQAALLAWFVAASAAKTPFIATTILGPLALFFLFSVVPQLAGLTSLQTAADLIFYMYAALALVFALAVQAIWTTFRRRAANP